MVYLLTYPVMIFRWRWFHDRSEVDQNQSQTFSCLCRSVFSGDYALEYTATRSFRTRNGGTRSRKSGGTWCWLQRFILRMVWLVVFTEYQLHLQSEALRSCSEGQNFLFPCWNNILSFLLQMFRLTRPPEAQIRTNLRPSVASVGLSFLGDCTQEYTAKQLSGHGTHSRRSGGTWCW